jgi:hypothetical protein
MCYVLEEVKVCVVESRLLCASLSNGENCGCSGSLKALVQKKIGDSSVDGNSMK